MMYMDTKCVNKFFVPNPQNKGRVFEKNFSKFPSISVFASW